MATSVQQDDDLCPNCQRSLGLCGKDHCRRQVLPLLAQPARSLHGIVRTEQTKRQAPKDRKADRHLDRIARRNARKVAKSQRRGYFGLTAMMAHPA